MTISYKSSSTSPGTSDSESASRDVAIPSDADIDDIAIVSIEMWQSTITDPVVTSPGFTQFINVSVATGSGFQRLKMFQKRLDSAESGVWPFTWSGVQWNMAHAVLISGAKKAGDPVGLNFNTATGTGTSEPSVSLPTPVDFEPFLLHTIANENSSSQNTPPTSYTGIQNGNYLKSNYRIPGTTGLFSASNGVLSASTFQIAALVAIEPEVESEASGMASISDTARANMLADRVLAEPQRLSNVDLMRLILADGAQTLVVKTDATAAVHLWRYLRTVRDS